MGPKSGHFSSYRAFPKVRIWHNDINHVAEGLVHSKGSQNYQNNEFEGVEGGHPGEIYTYIYIHIFSYLPGGRARKALIHPPPTPTRVHPRVPTSQACSGRLAWRPKVSIASKQNARFTQKRKFCGHRTHDGCKGGRRPLQGRYEPGHAWHLYIHIYIYIL